ncbi:hypothetical protein HW555_001168 [Spodoptera exigua]|uniref:Uncharacterized protein n=1 Tax=Spodoptera exigua TaxID=7107 RepID=A0A835LAL5_SPOEX|nr:hypothetical protein HW555_001168 [Spodoptera exigua]
MVGPKISPCDTPLLPYNIRNHPCCLEPNENLTLAMIIDAFEIYGHDPTDKLDNLWLYQNEMMRIKTAEDQYLINERVHIATDHLGRFIKLHIQELKVLLITLDDVIDNMLTMYENHNSVAAERKATYTGGPVPMEFYMSQEFYCGKNVYIFISELYSDIYNMGKGVAPYCKDRSFVFLGFLHFHDETKYYLLDDPSISFPTDNYLHGLECHMGICIFRFPFKKLLQRVRDVSALPKAIVKCGTEMYKLPPLSAASCIITSGSFILDFNIQGVRYRHYDYLLTIPNGHTYYTKEAHSPLVCDHHVCTGIDAVPPYIEPTPKPDGVLEEENITVPYILDGCLFMYPPNYGSIAGKSYLDTIDLHDDRFTCNAAGGNKGLYWYPQWMGAMPHHPYPALGEEKDAFEAPGAFYPHQQGYDMDEQDIE